jgi:hypothetical protein
VSSFVATSLLPLSDQHHILETLQKLSGIFSRSGLLALSTFNLISLFPISFFRHVEHSGDQIDYIHKYVFDFPSNPHSSTTLPSASQLETQFTTELVQRFPVLSQLFLRPIQCEEYPIESWRLSRECEIPDLEMVFSCFSKFDGRYDIVPNADEVSPGAMQIRGQACKFVFLAGSWLKSGVSSSNELLGIAFDRSDIALRKEREIKIPFLAALPTRQVTTNDNYHRWLVSRPKQRDCITQFMDLVKDEDVRVLLMADTTGQERSPRLAFGLIIIRIHNGSSASWQRLGFCLWFPNSPNDGIDPQGNGVIESKWEHINDTFS